MREVVAEAVGTMLLIIFGDGVVAAVLLAKSKAQGSGWIVIATGWGLAVAIAVYAVGRVSGAHINPAVTLALAATQDFDPAMVVPYIVAQFVGAIIGAVLVYLAYLAHWGPTEDPALKLGVFCTGPAVRNAPANFITEVIGTAVLVFGVLAIVANFSEGVVADAQLRTAFATAISPLLVGVLVWGIGLSLGGPTGYAINPARDLGPRIAHAVLPIPGKGPSDWGYSWIPVVAPIVGGILGGLLFNVTLR
jgi:glycerol uptake facilitator protein